MTCTSCSNSIETALNKLPGIKKAVVALATEECEVQYDASRITHVQLMTAIDDLGYEVELISAGEERNKVRLQLEGLSTPEDVELIKVSLTALPGVTSVDMDLNGSMVQVSYDPDKTGPRCFIEVIEESASSGLFRANLMANPGQGGPDRTFEMNYYRKYFFWSCVFTVPVFLLSMVFTYIPGIKEVLNKPVVNMLNIGALLRWILATPVQFVLGRRFYVGAYKSLRNGSANMDVLIALGTNTAYFYSAYTALRSASSATFKGTDFFETSAMLISFILLGKLLEALAKGKTSEAIAKLMDLAPDTATLITLNEEGNVVQEKEISSQLIQRKDIIKVCRVQLSCC